MSLDIAILVILTGFVMADTPTAEGIDSTA